MSNVIDFADRADRARNIEPVAHCVRATSPSRGGIEPRRRADRGVNPGAEIGGAVRRCERVPLRRVLVRVEVEGQVHGVAGGGLVHRSGRRSAEEGAQPSFERGKVARLAFPDHHGRPARSRQGGELAPIPVDVPRQLVVPESGVRRGSAPPLAIVAVPEATVDEHDLTPRSEHDVGLTRQIGGVQPVPKTQPMRDAPNDQFGLRVAPAYAGHVRASGHGRKFFSHVPPPTIGN